MKRIISVVLCFLMIAGTCSVTAFADGEHLDIRRGDSDIDGTISVIDATAIQMMLVNNPAKGTFSMTAADITGDGLDISDATKIQLYLANLTDKKKDEVGKRALVWNNGTYIPVENYYKSVVDALMEENEFTGAVYITRNGRVLCESVYGKAIEKEDIDVTLDTRFAVGSVSKQICAAAVMLLKEQGKLDINDKLSKYFPEYETGGDITIKNLMSMRSGIRDFLDLIVPENGPVDEHVIKMSATKDENVEVIKEAIFSADLQYEPGKRFKYTNSNFFLLALIVEQVSQEKYEDFISEHFFRPLNMNSSGFTDEYYSTDKMAEHHVLGPIVVGDYKGVAFGCGDVVSSAIDMDLWLTSLRECTILSKESVAEMSTNYSDKINAYGYGLSIDEENGAVYHSGAIDSYRAYTYTDPNTNYNMFAVTSDYTYLNVEDIAYDLLDMTHEV